jgi:hypothetical protein
MFLYTVANIGDRPHNLLPYHVNALVRSISVDSLAILALKPGYYPNYPEANVPLQRYIEGMVTAASLDVLCTSTPDLFGIDVCELYGKPLH